MHDRSRLEPHPSGQTLAEIRRVLKPGGLYLYLEHGLADHPRITRWQNRLNGFCSRLACGCNLNRDMSVLIGHAGSPPSP